MPRQHEPVFFMGQSSGAHLGYGQSRAPLLLKDVQADAALAVDIGMVQLCLELNLGRFEWVIRREVNAAYPTQPPEPSATH